MFWGESESFITVQHFLLGNVDALNNEVDKLNEVAYFCGKVMQFLWGILHATLHQQSNSYESLVFEWINGFMD